MKKLLVMLLAVAMVLSMTFALASCGGDETTDESSKPAEESKVEASAASSDDDTTSEDSTSEDVTSEDDITSEDSTSEDVTSEDSTSEDVTSEDESKSDINYITTPTKVNYALGKTYTLTRDSTETDPGILYLQYSNGSTDWSDHENKKMTDGAVGDITNEGYGGSMCGLEGYSVMLQGTNKTFEYVIDLGDYYGDIKSLVFRNVRHGTPNGNNRGFKLRLAYVSDNGVDWTKVEGNLTSAPISGAPEVKSNKEEGAVNVEHFDFTYTLHAAAQGKFVRVILISDGGYIIQLEEIEIWN